jgi:hypothetical protein
MLLYIQHDIRRMTVIVTSCKAVNNMNQYQEKAKRVKDDTHLKWLAAISSELCFALAHPLLLALPCPPTNNYLKRTARNTTHNFPLSTTSTFTV